VQLEIEVDLHLDGIAFLGRAEKTALVATLVNVSAWLDDASDILSLEVVTNGTRRRLVDGLVATYVAAVPLAAAPNSGAVASEAATTLSSFTSGMASALSSGSFTASLAHAARAVSGAFDGVDLATVVDVVRSKSAVEAAVSVTRVVTAKPALPEPAPPGAALPAVEKALSLGGDDDDGDGGDDSLLIVLCVFGAVAVALGIGFEATRRQKLRDRVHEKMRVYAAPEGGPVPARKEEPRRSYGRGFADHDEAQTPAQEEDHDHHDLTSVMFGTSEGRAIRAMHLYDGGTHGMSFVRESLGIDRSEPADDSGDDGGLGFGDAAAAAAAAAATFEGALRNYEE